MESPQFTLKPNPDWHAAAQDLIHGLCALAEGEQRIDLLEHLCIRLGDNLYPAFLQILHVVQKHGTNEARATVAKTLVECLQSGRLPSGKLAAWGSSSYSGDSAFGQSRRLGPIEFVCAWYAQPSTESPMSQQQFSTIMDSLLSLVAADKNAKMMYCFKLQSDAQDPIDGSLSGQTRAGLTQLTESWRQTSDSEPNTPAIDAFMSALQSESLLNQISHRPFT